MSSAWPDRAWQRWRTGSPWLMLAHVLLGAWAAGILVAGWQLEGWRQDLTRTLLQLNADARFRASAPSREAVDPEWYRRKALALLGATERLQQDAAWTRFLPGSWKPFDDLEERVQTRLAREFNDIVVETVRRELDARASALTGVPLVRGTGELRTGTDCRSPVPQDPQRRLTAAPEDLPEFVAVGDYVREVERLDAAVQSFLLLQNGGSADPEALRRLVQYTLGKELPGPLAGALRMFQGDDGLNIEPARMLGRLQWATRCSLRKAMGSLHTRLLGTNDLFALEQGYVERSQGLFAPAARNAGFDRTLERYRSVHALLEDQNALLARGRNDWMRQGTLQLGSAYEQLLHRIAATRLFGPDTVRQLESQSGAAFAEFRRQFELAFGGPGEPGIVWLEGERRFGLSPQREALREGLGALLKLPFMGEEPPSAGKDARQSTTLPRIVQEARALAAERRKAHAAVVPLLPPAAQPAVARVIDARVSELIYQRAFRTLKAALPADGQAPLDVAAFRNQREQVLALQVLLKETGGAGFGERLVATLDGELLRRLALLQDAWGRQPMLDARWNDLAWWQGEPLSLARGLGAVDAGSAAPPSFGPLASRLELLVQEASPLLALASPELARDPQVLRWMRLRTALERYTAHSADSSLAELERYVAALGPDLRRENCVERLSAHAPGPGEDDDEIASRHRQLHQALARRCQELRLQAAASAGAAVPQ